MANLSKMESKIPLFRFPFVVLWEVFRSMCPFELVNISKASQKSKQLIKSFATGKLRKKFTLDCSVSNDEFGIRLRSSCFKFAWEYCIISDPAKHGATAVHNVGERTEQIYKCSENMLEEFKRQCEYIQEVFGWKIDGLAWFLDSFPKQNRMIIDWLRSRQEKFKFFEIYSEIDTDNDLKYLLETLKTTDHLNISSKIKDDFQVELPENIDYLHFDHARFVKFEQFLRLRARKIQLRETTITSQEINTFLKSWMVSEAHKDLKYLRIGIKNEAAMDVILDEIPHEILEADDVMTFEFAFLPVNGGFVIKRNDGKSARIATGRHAGKAYMKMCIY